MLRKSFIFGLMLIVLLAMSTNLMASNMSVDRNTDTNSGSGNSGDLRYCIANVGDGEEITFDDDYTITLASQLTIDKNLTITGTGAGKTIIQANALPNTATYRVFNISTGTVILEDMTIRNGKTASNGGGIYHDSATLTLNNCTVSGNTASNYGGGIYKYVGNLIMTNCTVNGNTAVYSGGIHNWVGNLAMTSCTVSGNTANDGSWSGGGLTNESDMSTITNCTFANNTSTYSNGGGIYLYAGNLYIKNTIIANNSGNSAPADYYYNSGTLNDNGYNIVETTNVGAGSGGFTDDNNNNIVGEQANLWGNGVSATPDLADNHTLNETQTIRTITGSVAIDAGTSSGAPATDQRGADRKGATDIGAYEWWDDSGSLPVTLSTFTAQYLNSKPTLYWQTQSEKDNMGWFIYRNTVEDFTSAEKISGMLPGHGTTTQPQSYIYEDAEQLQVEQTYYYWLESVDYSGTLHHFDMVAHITIPHTNDPGQNITPPVAYEITADPNPFSQTTEITFAMSQTSLVDVAIYNLKGQLVKSFDTVMTNADEDVSFQWNGKDDSGKSLSNGVYLYSVKVNGQDYATKQLILMK